MSKAQINSVLKSRYIHTAWFQTATNKDIEYLIEEPLFKLEIEFNAYGVIEPQQFLNKHKQKIQIILAKYKQSVNDFKFKFVGWGNVNFKISEFIEPINKNIKANFISLNLSKFRGSDKEFLDTIKIFFQKKCKSLSLNFANWKMKYDTIKQLNSGGYVITNDLEKLHLDLSGWGEDIDYFFNIRKEKQGDHQAYKVKKQGLVNEFKQVMEDFFRREILTSVQQEVLMDLRNWHKDFRLEQTKKHLYNLLKEGFQMASMMSYSKSDNSKPIFKLNFVI